VDPGERVAAVGLDEQRDDGGHDQDGLQSLTHQDDERRQEGGAGREAARVEQIAGLPEQAFDLRRLLT
jgi:hypothetical protein